MRTLTFCLSFLAFGGYAISQGAAPTNSERPGEVQVAAAIDTAPGAAVDSGEDWRRYTAGIDHVDWRLRQQEPDYTIDGMFQQDHGEFMVKRRRFQPHIIGRLTGFPESSIDSEPGDFDLMRATVDARIPMAVAPDGYLELGGYFDARRYNVSSIPGWDDDTYYAVGLHLGGGYFVREDILIEAMFSPGIWSDFDGTLHSQDFQWFVSALATWQVREDLFLKGGISYNEVFRDAPVLPVLGVSWLITPEWRVDILMPNGYDTLRDGGRAELSFAPGPAATLYTALDIEGGEYQVRGTGGVNPSSISVQEVRWGVGGIYRFDDYVSIFAEVGAVVAGDYKVRDSSAVPYADGSLDPGVFLEIGAGFTF